MCRASLALMPLLFASIHAESTKSLLAKYKTATCTPRLTRNGNEPYWDSTATLPDGSTVRVEASGIVGGAVIVFFSPDVHELAAKPWDYIYPADIRIGSDDRLYIIAGGLAGGIWRRTILYVYDLRGRKQVTHRGVRDKNLPPRCPAR